MNGDAAAHPVARAHPDPLPDLPEKLLAGYLDAALDTLRGVINDPNVEVRWSRDRYRRRS